MSHIGAVLLENGDIHSDRQVHYHAQPSKNLEGSREREFFIGNLLARIHFIIEMIW